MVRRAQNLPADKIATPREQEERDFYHHNKDSLYHEGIRMGEEGYYDPNAGSQKVREPLPDRSAGPLLATDPGQPRIDPTPIIGRSAHVDKSEQRVVSSGRKVSKPTEE